MQWFHAVILSVVYRLLLCCMWLISSCIGCGAGATTLITTPYPTWQPSVTYSGACSSSLPSPCWPPSEISTLNQRADSTGIQFSFHTSSISTGWRINGQYKTCKLRQVFACSAMLLDFSTARSNPIRNFPTANKCSFPFWYRLIKTIGLQIMPTQAYERQPLDLPCVTLKCV